MFFIRGKRCDRFDGKARTINLDLLMCVIMDEMGKAMMNCEAEGEDRAIQASRRLLLIHFLMRFLCGAKGVLINITGGYDLTLLS